MILFPAIDIYNNMAVRLLRGEYNQMTVYNPNPAAVAKQLEAAGATHIHMVDLEGARDGDTPNRDIICAIASSTPCFVQVGGGIRSLGTIERYVEGGVDRVILGTAAVTQEGFVKEAVKRYGDKIAVGVDIKDGKVAIKGWRETSEWGYEAFCRRMKEKGVKTLICTDISKDGAMKGTNHALYRDLSQQVSMQIIASGGVSSLEDIKTLQSLGLHGAIMGKAYYTGAIDLKKALELVRNQTI